MPKDAYYFPHDCNARNDPKILKIRSIFKSEGYGWFWMFIEMMREQENYLLPLDGKESIDAYAMQMQCDSNALASFINKSIEIGLFAKDDKHLWSDSLLRRMSNYDLRSDQARIAALKRWHGDADAMPTQCDSNASKVKESKVKESKVNNIKDAISTKSPFGEKLRELFARLDKERGYPLTVKRKAEAASMMRMLKKEYTTDQIIETWRSLKSEPFYSDKELTMMTVEGQIGAKLNGRTGRNQTSDNQKQGKHSQSIPGNRPAGAFNDIEA